MKILIVSSFLPHPLFSGGHIRLFNLIKELSKKNEITLICEKRPYQTNKNIEELEKICKKIITVPRRKQWSIGNLLRTGFSSNSFLVQGHTNSDMKKVIRKELSISNYDLIHVETFYVVQNVPKTKIPIVLVEHNIEYLVYKRYTSSSNFLLRPVFNLDVSKIKQEEKKAWQRAAKVVAVSETEKKLIEKDDVAIVPNGVDIEEYKPLSKKRKDNEKIVLFIGEFKWIQNVKAVEWILKEIWPEILKSVSKEKVKLWIVGRKIPDSLKEIGGEKVFFDENAPEETVKIYQKADVLLAPIRVGGGTSYKILESLSTGLPVVTTGLGSIGIGAKPGRDLLVGETAKELGNLVVRLLNDKRLVQKVAKNGRLLIEERYDWKKIADKLQSVYEKAIK